MSPRLPNRLLAAQSDRRLLELVATGHERAFEVLVHRYRRQLLRYCGRLGLSDSRAEDALQQSFLRAWLSLCRGVEVRELKPWLYRIVHNTAVNMMRSSREHHAPLSDVAEITFAAAVENGFEQRIAVRDALADVAALPPMQREAILLSAIDGRSHEEVASALGITHGAVRGLLYRARATLRSAAAALIPPPLLAWAAGSAGRVAPTASRLAELSGGAGGSEAGGALLKGVAVALTSAAAAGAVLGPLPNSHTQRGGSAASRGVAGAHTTAATVSPRGAGLDASVGVAVQLAPILAAPARQRLALRRGRGPASARTRANLQLRERSGSNRGDSGSHGGSDAPSGTHRDGAPAGSLPSNDSGGQGPSVSGGGDGSLIASSGSGTSDSGTSSGSGTSGSGTSSGSGDSHTGGSGDGGLPERDAEAARVD